ncbi:MAG: hypothetical protein JOZ52_01675, partial [Acidobacteria bacterium]|nr:hypothetical protein [Acidobacteriota bacterium]
MPALLFLALAYPATILAQANPTARYTISPGSVQRGTGLNDVYLQATDQQHKDLSDITEVAASDGSGVSFKSKQLMNDNQLLKIKLDVSEDAEAGVTRLSITRKAPTATDANATKTETVDLTIIELKPLAPGPIPTKSPQVDAMWALVPDKVVKDNFG